MLTSAYDRARRATRLEFAAGKLLICTPPEEDYPQGRMRLVMHVNHEKGIVTTLDIHGGAKITMRECLDNAVIDGLSENTSISRDVMNMPVCVSGSQYDMFPILMSEKGAMHSELVTSVAEYDMHAGLPAYQGFCESQKKPYRVFQGYDEMSFEDIKTLFTSGMAEEYPANIQLVLGPDRGRENIMNGLYGYMPASGDYIPEYVSTPARHVRN